MNSNIVPQSAWVPWLGAVAYFGLALLSPVQPLRAETTQTLDSPEGPLAAVTYGHGQYVAVGQYSGGGAKIVSSPDAVEWRARRLGLGADLNAIAFGAGTFVAVGHWQTGVPIILWSQDALEWTPVPVGGVGSLHDVVYGGGRFVAVGGEAVLVSSNGTDWVRYAAEVDTLSSVAHGNGLFVAAGASSLLVSTNGSQWTLRSAGAADPIDIAFGDGRFVLLSYFDRVFTSTDAVGWNETVTSVETRVVGAGRNVFIGTDYRGLYRLGNDGQWTNAFTAPRHTITIREIGYGAGRFVAVGQEYGTPTLQTILVSTNDGVSWSEVPFAPRIVEQPVFDDSQPVGFLHMRALGTPPLFYEWRLNGEPLAGPEGAFPYVNITNKAEQAGEYSMVVSNAAGVATSQTARVSADLGAPYFYCQPFGGSVYAGSEFALYTCAVRGNAPISLQWQFNGIDIPGAIDHDLRLPNIRTDQAGCYTVVASNAAGTVTSRVAVVNVLVAAPRVSLPARQFVLAGTPVTFEVLPLGGPLPVYRWMFNGFTLPGQTNRYLALGSVTTNHSGAYTVWASNSFGVSTSTGELEVYVQRPLLTLHPTNQTVVEGSLVTFVANASAGPPADYFLQFNGQTLPLPYEPGFSILEVTTNDAGAYSIVASNYLGAVTSQVATLTVLPAGPLDRWTRRNPLPQGSHLLALADNGEQIIAVGESGAILSSTNGIHWEVKPQRTQMPLNGIAYGGGIFATVGRNGTILTSSNGTDWLWRFSSLNQNLSSVAYGAGRFVAALSPSLVLTSLDGVHWEPHLIPEFGANAVTFGNGLFVAVGTGGRVFISGDGINWARASSRTFVTLEAVHYGNGLYVAVGNDGTVITSLDASEWTVRTTPTTRRLLGVSSGNGRFVAVGTRGTILSSADGAAWVEEQAGTPDRLEAVTFFKNMFIAVGENGTTLTSPNAVAWTRRNTGSTRDLDGMTIGDGQIVVVGKVGTVLTSRGGDRYLEQHTGVTNDLHGIAWHNGLYVAVGEGIVSTSPDAVVWTTRATTTNSMKAVAYGGGNWVAVGTEGLILSSSDAMHWQTQVFPRRFDLNEVAYGNGVFVIAGDASPRNATILVSTDGAHWVDRTVRTGKNLRTVTYANGMFLAGGNDGSLLASADGHTWNPRHSGLFEDGQNLRGITWINGLWIIVGNRGIILTSPDTITWKRRPARTTENLHAVRSMDGRFVAIGNRGTILQTGRVFGTTLLVRTYLPQVGFEIGINAEPGRQHRLQATSNLRDWQDLFDFSNTQSETIYFDEEAIFFPQRFYRVVTP